MPRGDYTTRTGSGSAFSNVSDLGSNVVGGRGDYLNFANLMQQAQQSANAARIPGAADLQSQSSSNIAGLLNPPALFPDTLRMAAETASAKGVAGSGSAYSTAVKMSDEERLKRMALGEQFLTGALARNPSAPLPSTSDFILTPYQAAQIALQKKAMEDAIEIAKLRYGTGGVHYNSGGGGGHQLAPAGGGGSPWAGFMSSPWGPAPYSGPTSGTATESSSPFGGGSEFDLDAALKELGLGDDYLGDVPPPSDEGMYA